MTPSDDMAALTATYSRSMTEDQLLTALLDALRLYGWLVHHVRRSDKALQQGNPGFPDICAVHPKDGRLLFIECKAYRKQPTESQWAWWEALTQGPCHESRTWIVHPEDLDGILASGWITGVGR